MVYETLKSVDSYKKFVDRYYSFHSNDYYKICVLCCISWLPTHQVLNKLKQKNQVSSYKQLACCFCFCYDLMLMGRISPQAGFCQCPNLLNFLRWVVYKKMSFISPHTIIWCGCCCWCGGVLLFYVFQQKLGFMPAHGQHFRSAIKRCSGFSV